jgi:predicted GIY-YIG superfamily endonuclease
MKNWWVYVLRLEEGKYYVGITSQTPEIRMQEHLQHIRGANWTKLYPPIEIYYKEELGVIKKEDAEAIENLMTRKYMRQFGLNSARGGDLTKVEEYSKFFGKIYMKFETDALLIMLMLLFFIFVLTVLSFFK